MAFATIAVALAAHYRSARRPLWLVLASVAITCSTLTKLFGIYTVPAVLMLVIARWLDTDGIDRRARLLGLFRDLTIMLVTSVGVTLAFAAVTDPLLVWDQAVRFHLKARTSQVSDADLWRNIFTYWRSDRLLWAIAPFSVLCALGGWRGLPVFVWMLSTLIGLLQHQPVFPHHLIALAPPLAAAAAMGLAQLWRWPLRWWSGAQTASTRLLALGSGAVAVALALFIAATLLRQARADQELRRWAASDTKAAKADKIAARQLQGLTRPNDVVLTDALGVAFLANRDVPPGLTDTSLKRISTRNLLGREVIDESEKFHVSAVLLWTGRLSRMPEVLAWVIRQFPQHQNFGNGRDLYVRTIPPATD